MTTTATTNERIVMQTNKFRLATIADRQRTNLYYLAGAVVALAAAVVAIAV